MKDPLTQGWVDALQRAYSLARAGRLNELRGKYVRRFDDMGLHPESEAWGQVHLAENLDPALAAVGCAPEGLREAARADADREFRTEILEGAA